MLTPSRFTGPAPGIPMPARGLAARLYGYLFLDAFVLLYPLYALLFVETGLTTAQISSLFALWAVTGLVVEIPSGVWADAVSRRLLLVLAPLLSAGGFALWVLTPSYPAFAAGFVLWGTSGALQSGALESLVYEELHRSGAAARYATVMGRGRAAGTLAVAAATASAATVFSAGGYAAVGGASVLACLGCAAVAATFPECRDHPPGGAASDDGEDLDDEGPSGFRAFVGTLRAGLHEVRARPRVRAAVLLVPAVTAGWGALDEYTPLLAAGTGSGVGTVPYLLLLLQAGTVAGALLAGRGARLSRRGLAGLLVAAATATAVGALIPHPAGFVLLALAFGAFQLATVAADAWLQHAVTGPARSTVTSVAGLGTDVGTIAVYGLYAGGSVVAGHGTLFAAGGVAYLLIAWAVGRDRLGLSARPT